MFEKGCSTFCAVLAFCVSLLFSAARCANLRFKGVSLISLLLDAQWPVSFIAACLARASAHSLPITPVWAFTLNRLTSSGEAQIR